MLALVPCPLCGGVLAAGEMEKNFLNLPDSAPPGVYWYFMNGNLNGKEMTADLESMKAAGLWSPACSGRSSCASHRAAAPHSPRRLANRSARMPTGE